MTPISSDPGRAKGDIGFVAIIAAVLLSVVGLFIMGVRADDRTHRKQDRAFQESPCSWFWNYKPAELPARCIAYWQHPPTETQR